MGQHSPGHHGHHHRHSIFYRMRRWFRKNKKFAISVLVLCVVTVSGMAAFVYKEVGAQSRRHVTAGKSVDVKSGYRNITYQGKDYQYNSLITTVLYAGVDSEGEMKASKAYSNKARADSISLVILDKKHKKMSILALNRDTMTKIRRYSRNGSDMGTYVSHLGYAYSYGDGGKVSCEDLREAVSNLLGGIPVNEYAVTNRSSMTYINDLVGKVTVTVPNDDLAAQYPELKKGSTVTLDDTTIEPYLRYRDTTEDFSNEGRIERQQTYVTAYIEKLKAQLQKDLNGTWEKTQEMNAYVQTSITRNKYLTLANLLEKVSFSDADYYRPEGQDQQGDLHDEFYVDEDALQQLVIDLFYEEV